MDASYIDLPGSEIESIVKEEDRVVVRFSRAFVIQTMTGAKESTRWHQAGNLIFTGGQLETDPPQGKLICEGGDVGENVYTYRDMIPIPLTSQGHAHCDLRFRDNDYRLRIQAAGVTLAMEDRPYYIEHIKD
jgi:hypothetical protein